MVAPPYPTGPQEDLHALATRVALALALLDNIWDGGDDLYQTLDTVRGILRGEDAGP